MIDRNQEAELDARIVEAPALEFSFFLFSILVRRVGEVSRVGRMPRVGSEKSRWVPRVGGCRM